jgi:hypothetical protein
MHDAWVCMRSAGPAFPNTMVASLTLHRQSVQGKIIRRLYHASH